MLPKYSVMQFVLFSIGGVSENQRSSVIMTGEVEWREKTFLVSQARGWIGMSECKSYL